MQFRRPLVQYEHEIGGLTTEARVTAIACTITFFSVLFRVSWHMMEKHWAYFRGLNDSYKADNCSRVASTVHALVVTPVLIYGMLTLRWGPHYEALDDPWLLQLALTMSVGYFSQDLIIMLRYKTPMFKVFMTHHVIAIIPYLVYYFTRANIGIYLLCMYMLVEFCNVTYNFQQWYEDIGDTDHTFFAFCMYFSFIAWIFFRMVNPTWCVYATEKYIFDGISNADYWSLFPGYVCSYLVNVFCYLAFFFVLLPKVYRRWVPKSAEVVAAELQRKHEIRTVGARMTGEWAPKGIKGYSSTNGSASANGKASATRNTSRGRARKED